LVELSRSVVEVLLVQVIFSTCEDTQDIISRDEALPFEPDT
jgi:hypothetical protein